MLINILIESQKTSFGLNNLFINNCGMEVVLIVISQIKLLVLAINILLKRMFCIYYPVQFNKDRAEIKILINFGSKINTIIPAYAFKLSSKV